MSHSQQQPHHRADPGLPPYANGSTLNGHPSDDDDDDDDDACSFKEASSSRTRSVNGETHADPADTEDEDDDGDDAFYDAPDLADSIQQATSYKSSGNAHFSAGRYLAALDDYREGIACLPAHRPPPSATHDKIKGKRRAAGGRRYSQQGSNASSSEDEDEDEAEAERTQAPATGDSQKDETSKIRELADEKDERDFVEKGKPKSEEKIELEKVRGALWCNIAACHLKLEAYKDATEAATKALLDNPDYAKALQRRAIANEKLNTWSSLTNALEDYKKLAGMPGISSTDLVSVRGAVRRLPAEIEARKNDETKEMMDKLKGLGNTLLGKFGLSTDNFQFVKNEETGGYSMSFKQ